MELKFDNFEAFLLVVKGLTMQGIKFKFEMFYDSTQDFYEITLY